jgi:peptidoglycan/LPS O-acetylase OafA/YrhL
MDINNFLHLIGYYKNMPAVWSQSTHFFLSYAVILTLYRAGARRRFWIAFCAIVAIAFCIEFFFDPKFEGDPFFWGGVTDWTFYICGAFVAMLVAHTKYIKLKKMMLKGEIK